MTGSNDKFLAAVAEVFASKASFLHKTAIMLFVEPFDSSECFQDAQRHSSICESICA